MDEKYILSSDDLKMHFEEQKQLLLASIETFDNGLELEAKRMATTLRVLMHDTKNQHSLLGQLTLLNGYFLSTLMPYDDNQTHIYNGLITITFNGSYTKYMAMLDGSAIQRWVPFSTWWTEIVFVKKGSFSFSRKDLVTNIADTDGGAHVDPRLKAAYAELTRNNGLGMYGRNGKPINNKPELVAIRQKSHEFLRSFIPEHRRNFSNIGRDNIYISDIAIDINS